MNISDNERREIVKQIHNQWRTGNLRYKMHDGQLQIHNVLRQLPPDVRIRLMECCRGYGKSVLNVLMACEDCALPHPLAYPVRIVGPEKDQTVEIVQQIFDIISPEAPPGWIKPKGSTWLVGNNRIIVGGFNRGSIERMRGKRAKSIYIEEIRDVPSEQLEYGLKSVLLPMSLKARAPITAASTSPRAKLHTMNTLFKPAAVADNGYFHFDLYECPLYTEKDIQQAIKDCGGEDTEDFITEYLCISVDTKVKAAVPHFDETKHVGSFDFPKKPFKRWIVTDVGGIGDPTHTVLLYYDEDEAKVRVKAERTFQPQTPTSVMVEEWRTFEAECGLDEESEDKQHFMDCPGQFIVDLRVTHVFNARTVGKGGFQESLRSLDQGFVDNEIEIHEDCEQLIHQLKTGKVNKSNKDFERSDSVGYLIAHHCDGVAALMYGWRMRDMTRIIKMPDINPDTEWIHPKLKKTLEETEGLAAIRPKIKRF